MRAPSVAGVAPYVASRIFMDTLVCIEIVGVPSPEECAGAVEPAFGWFHEVEQRCSRFDPGSELMRLCAAGGPSGEVSPLLFAAIEFAVGMAHETGGAFDPTVGAALRRRGFDRNFRTGARSVSVPLADPAADYRDIELDAANRGVRLHRPLVLDLGAVAKGFAIDLAARELARFENVAINAGGDLFLRGENGDGAPWSIGIRHPREDGALIDVIAVSGLAVCTSGDYERREDGSGQGHHIFDTRSGASAHEAVIATVLAPTAMVADAFATAAFVLGPKAGLALLQRHGLDGMIISPALERFETAGFTRARQ
jgi:thiamine biosynthesis lipoprotein